MTATALVPWFLQPVLAGSKQLGTSPSWSPRVSLQLDQVFDDVVTVDPLDSGDAANMSLLERPELGVTFTKLHCWTLTKFSKCMFLDADTLVIGNSDDLFNRE